MGRAESVTGPPGKSLPGNSAPALHAAMSPCDRASDPDPERPSLVAHPASHSSLPPSVFPSLLEILTCRLFMKHQPHQDRGRAYLSRLGPHPLLAPSALPAHSRCLANMYRPEVREWPS